MTPPEETVPSYTFSSVDSTASSGLGFSLGFGAFPSSPWSSLASTTSGYSLGTGNQESFTAKPGQFPSAFGLWESVDPSSLKFDACKASSQSGTSQDTKHLAGISSVGTSLEAREKGVGSAGVAMSASEQSWLPPLAASSIVSSARVGDAAGLDLPDLSSLAIPGDVPSLDSPMDFSPSQQLAGINTHPFLPI